MISQFLYDSPLGPLYLVADEFGLIGVHWNKQLYPVVKILNRSKKNENILIKTKTQLDEYFKGKRTEFDIPLSEKGTTFQLKVWKALKTIPFGKTKSYQDIANIVKKPQAYRAVGTANGKNPISIIIPCHRVINADGKLGGYAGGLKIKKQLLKLEGLGII